MDFVPKVVDNNHYHLWTDALHARALAHQTTNKWDCGSYVRWTVAVGWTVMEMACQDALQDDDISYRFRENLDRAVKAQGLRPIDWGSGTWQRVAGLRKTRKDLMHSFASLSDMFPGSEIADEAISVVRAGVLAVYDMAGRKKPLWINDDDDPGWPTRGSAAHASVLRAGVSADDPLAIRVSYVCDGHEYEHEVMPPDADFEPVIYALLRTTIVPISRVNVRRGEELIHTVDVNMRGT